MEVRPVGSHDSRQVFAEACRCRWGVRDLPVLMVAELVFEIADARPQAVGKAGLEVDVVLALGDRGGLGVAGAAGTERW